MVLLCLSPAILFGQIKIGGTVTHGSRQPLPGVSVLVKGTHKGSVTDANGRFLFTAEKVRC
jgi:hypothetical protein